MLRNIPIRRAGRSRGEFSCIVSISVILPSAGASRSLLLIGISLFGSRKNDSIHISITARGSSSIIRAVVDRAKKGHRLIMAISIAGKKISCGKPYLVSGILIIEYDTLCSMSNQVIIGLRVYL